jgi:hypothetical protein
MTHTACLVCFIATVNGHSNKKQKKRRSLYPWKAGARSRHITNLKQSILETFDIYGLSTLTENLQIGSLIRNDDKVVVELEATPVGGFGVDKIEIIHGVLQSH